MKKEQLLFTQVKELADEDSDLLLGLFMLSLEKGYYVVRDVKRAKNVLILSTGVDEPSETVRTTQYVLKEIAKNDCGEWQGVVTLEEMSEKPEEHLLGIGNLRLYSFDKSEKIEKMVLNEQVLQKIKAEELFLSLDETF